MTDSLDVFRSLPIQLTSFVGRGKEMLDLEQLLETSRFITLTGSGGSGKTRLALAIAGAASQQKYPDGVYWVEFASLTDESLVPQTVAKVLNVTFQPDNALLESLIDYLADRKILVVLDNCEHLLSACGVLVELMLRAPGVRILITSREQLSVEGEVLYPVTPLSLPPDDSTNSEMEQFDAVRLFVERAHSALHGFELTGTNRSSVARICRRLDGIPLAIEMASARINVLSAEQIEARLNDRFTLLKVTNQARPAHHQTLRALIDWSYNFLSREEQILLRRLSVLPAAWTIDSVQAICADAIIPKAEILDLLSSLVNKSLVVADTVLHAQARYHLLETIREYSLDQLDQPSETSQVRDRHLEFFVQQAEQHTKKLHSEYQRLWLNWMELEHDNFRAALEWSLSSHRVEAGLRLANALYEFWGARGYVQEGFNWFERLLAHKSDETSAVLAALATIYASFLAAMLGDSARALSYGQQGITLSEAAGSDGTLILAMALGAVSGAARTSGDHATAYEYAGRAISLMRGTGVHFGMSMSLLSQGNIATALGKYDEAHKLLHEGRALAEKLGDGFRQALALNYLGDLARCEQVYRDAQVAYEESLAIFQELGAVRECASLIHNLGYTSLHLDNTSHAAKLFRESLEMHRAQRNRHGIAECITGFAAVAVRWEQSELAAGLLAASTRFGGRAVTSMWPAERKEYEAVFSTIRQKMTEQEFEAAQTEGRAWSLEQSIEVAFTLPIKNDQTANGKLPQFGLSARELEIVRLIAEGQSNTDIANHFVLSKRTVEKHVANIFAKLNLSNRTQAARWATEHLLKAQ